MPKSTNFPYARHIFGTCTCGKEAARFFGMTNQESRSLVAGGCATDKGPWVCADCANAIDSFLEINELILCRPV